MAIIATPSARSAQPPLIDEACVVTLPNGLRLVRDPSLPAAGNHGNDARTLATVLPRDGIVRLGSRAGIGEGGSGCLDDDGSVGTKWPWWRAKLGPLMISGRRLDGDARPLHAWIPNGYGRTGFQSSGVFFRTPGCWEVTGHTGGEAITFVVRAVMIGEKPKRQCHPPADDESFRRNWRRTQ